METQHLGFIGQAPTVTITRDPNYERKKYERMWEFNDYRVVSPGEQSAVHFIKVAQPPRGACVVDFGAGTGRGAVALAMLGGLRVHMLDFASNSLDDFVAEAVRNKTQPLLSFAQHDLMEPYNPVTVLGAVAEYGYCTDVMEHIPTDDVPIVLQNVLAAAKKVFFQISLKPDVMGSLIGEPLHLTVFGPDWWMKKLTDAGATIIWAQHDNETLMVYCTAWMDLNDESFKGSVNVGDEAAFSNIRKNVMSGWLHAKPHMKQDTPIMLLAGGPSLNDYEETIRIHRNAGMPMVTVNGTYNWATERGLLPSAQIVVDAREFNKRFVSPVYDKTKYLIASQCHPEVLKGLPFDRTFLWHVGLNDTVRAWLTENLNEWYSVLGGSTVVLRGLMLLHMLGFRKIHIYGFDSCLLDNVHHAYVQPENDNEEVVEVKCGGRVFKCHPWMVAQAHEFIGQTAAMGQDFELAVYGDGLIAHILNTGASLSTEEEQ